MSPIPVNVGNYLVQHEMTTLSGAADNTFVNTFFFLDTIGPRDVDDVADDIKVLLDTFYNAVNAPGAVAISSRFSRYVDPLTAHYKVYDLGVPAPRFPTIRDSNMVTVAANAYPNEVAVVLSFRSGPGGEGGGTNDKRARGRIYLGPLGTAAIDALPLDTDMSVSTSFIAALQGGAEFLADPAHDVRWSQYSRVANAFGVVTGGFIGNRPDTQRRRGAEQDARTVWSP